MFYKHTKSQLYTSCNTLSHSQYHTLLTSSIHIVDELVCLQTCQPSQQTKECSSILCPTVTYITYMYLMSHTWRRLSVVSRGSCVKESSALRGNFALGGKNCQAPASQPNQARLSLSHPEVEWINNLTSVWKIMFQIVNLNRTIMFGVQYSMTLQLKRFNKGE